VTYSGIGGTASNSSSVEEKKVKKDNDDDAVLIVNPSSCSGLTGKNWDDLYASIKERAFGGHDVEVAFSTKAGDGTALARAYLRKGFTKIFAIGGDGTANEVANGFFEPIPAAQQQPQQQKLEGATTSSNFFFPALRPINPDAAIAFVPCGTRNVLARSLSLPAGVVECCQVVAGTAGKLTKMDVIGVCATDPQTGKQGPARLFFNAAEMGVAAEIIDRSKKIRKVVKSRAISTAAAIVSTLPTYESNQCEISIDGRVKEVNMTMAVVANGRFLGGEFLAAPEADVRDGLLDLLVLEDSDSLMMLDEMVNISAGDYSGEDKIIYTKAKSVFVRSKERQVTVTVDGEPVGVLPAAFQVFPGALNVMM
jgi:diacylglycerol kinase family enzyme